MCSFSKCKNVPKNISDWEFLKSERVKYFLCSLKARNLCSSFVCPCCAGEDFGSFDPVFVTISVYWYSRCFVWNQHQKPGASVLPCQAGRTQPVVSHSAKRHCFSPSFISVLQLFVFLDLSTKQRLRAAGPHIITEGRVSSNITRLVV